MATKSETYLAAYNEYSKILRTWLVAYGIGAPVLLLTNDAISKALKVSGNGKLIAGCFLFGVVIQVILATLNKASMWGVYYGEENSTFQQKWPYQIAFRFSECYLIDFLVDVVTLIVFAVATWNAFSVLIV